MSQKMICKIPSLSASYEIEVGSDILQRQILFLKGLATRFALVTDENVAALYGVNLFELLKSSGLEASLFTFEGNEENKSRKTKEELENRLFESGFGRDSCIIALGGGIVTDVAGFVAATFCRGVPLVMMPTTLLGMIDASIGGKTGVNLPFGKNLIGAIHQPKKVVIDLSTLKTLQKKELRNGMIEMVKHALIADAEYFKLFENQREALLRLDSAILESAIVRSSEIKKEIVEEDEKEVGKRRLLNFGHTIGHAIEHLSKFTVSHGDAVAVGMIVESYLSYQLGILDFSNFERIMDCIWKTADLDQFSFKLDGENLVRSMKLDKKALKSMPRFVILEKIGACKTYGGAYCIAPDEALVQKSIDWMNNALCCH